MARIQFLVESPYEKKIYRLEGERILVGRSRAAEIPLLDEAVKKRHVLLTWGEEGIRFRDLSNGRTLKNDVEETVGGMRVGDRLQLGSTTITLQAILGPRASAARGEVAPPEVPAEPDPEEIAGRSVRLDPAADDSFMAGGLRSVLEINKKLARERSEQDLLALIMDAAIDLTGAERGYLLLATEGRLQARVAKNLHGDPITDPELAISRTIAQDAIKTRRSVLSSDAGVDERWTGLESIAALKLRSVLSVPLITDEGVLGALYVDNRFERGLFGERHVGLLEAFADQAAAAIVSFRLADRLRRRGAELEKKNREVERLNARMAVELDRAKEDLESRQHELEFKYDYRQIVGRSRAIKQLLTTLDKVTDVNVPVFIEGESGTGKELVARALHFNGPRRRSPFITENCSAIPETLIEKVLFGHVKGAFTGADEDAAGLFEQAHQGTLFLDEVGDMSPEMQKKILRVLQEGEVRRVGGKEMKSIDVRIVCATNRDVDALREEGGFREDLFWRLVVVRIRIPPLRERPEDIPLLVDHFLELHSSEMGVERKEMEAGALDLLTRYPWPGNVRELGNEVRRAVALAGDRIASEVLSERVRTAPPGPAMEWAGERPLKEVVEEVERSLISRAVERHGGNKTRVAAALGLSRLGLRNKMQRYGLEG